MPSNRPTRKYHRLRNYDYASAGLYFVTFCTAGKKCFLSIINDQAQIELGIAGLMVEQELRVTELKRADVTIIDEVIMPNHVHFVIQLNGANSTGQRNEFAKPLSGTIGTIVGKIKSQVTARLRERYNNPEVEVWQEKYHDHVIRNEASLRRIQQYIRDNPGNWIEDRYHPDRMRESRARRKASSRRPE